MPPRDGVKYDMCQGGHCRFQRVHCGEVGVQVWIWGACVPGKEELHRVEAREVGEIFEEIGCVFL